MDDNGIRQFAASPFFRQPALSQGQANLQGSVAEAGYRRFFVSSGLEKETTLTLTEINAPDEKSASDSHAP